MWKKKSVIIDIFLGLMEVAIGCGSYGGRKCDIFCSWICFEVIKKSFSAAVVKSLDLSIATGRPALRHLELVGIFVVCTSYYNLRPRLAKQQVHSAAAARQVDAGHECRSHDLGWAFANDGKLFPHRRMPTVFLIIREEIHTDMTSQP